MSMYYRDITYYRVLQCKNYKRIFKPKFNRVDNTMAKRTMHVLAPAKGVSLLIIRILLFYMKKSAANVSMSAEWSPKRSRLFKK